MLADLLHSLGLSAKEQSIYLTLAGLGVQPASVVAKKLGLDRVVTYKHLKEFETMGLAKVYLRDGVQYFGVTGAQGIAGHLQEKARSIQELEKTIPDADAELRRISRTEGFVPTMQVFQGASGIRGLFRDILFECKQEGVLRIRMLTSNTFDQQRGSVPLSAFMGKFFQESRESNVGIEMLEASGTLLPEFIRRIDPQHLSPDVLPAARGATNVFLVGSALYLASYGDSQIGLKIKHQEMSQIFHFFFDVISKNVPPHSAEPARGTGEWLKEVEN